jgi:hypothetical protein
MGISEALLNEVKSWDVIEKRINTIRKKIDKIDTEILQVRKDCIKAGAEPDDDWSSNASYATDELKGILDKAQELVDLFK